MNILPEAIHNKLVEELHYPEETARLATLDLLAMPAEYQDAFEKWFASGTIPDMPVLLGFTPAILATLCRFQPPAAFLALDWLRRDPEEAAKALMYEYHLKVPYTPPEKTD